MRSPPFLVLALAACGNATGSLRPDAQAPAHAAPAAAVPFVPPGAPHAFEIDRVLLDAEGRAALTRDSGLRVRLWPALDGSVEPRAVPLAEAQRLAFARRGDAFTIAGLDAAGAAHVIRVEEGGTVRALADLPPTPALRALAVLPDREALLGLGADHGLRLLGEDGRVLAELTPREFRARDFALAADGRSAVLWELQNPAPAGPAGRFSGSARRVTIGPSSLALDGEPLAFEASSFEGTPDVAISPDARTLAVAVADEKASWRLVAHDLAAGTAKQLEIPPGLASRLRLSFVSPTRLYVSALTSYAWVLDLGGELARRPAYVPGVAGDKPQSGAGGRIAVGQGAWLFVGDPLDAADRHWLGYGDAGAVSTAVSPAGRRVAWVVGSGKVRVEPLGGGDRLPPLAIADAETVPVTDVAFLDEDRLITLGPAHGLRLYDVTTGALVARAEIGGPYVRLELDPGRRLVRVAQHGTDALAWIFEVGPEGFRGPWELPRTARTTAFVSEGGVTRLFTIGADDGVRVLGLDDLRKPPATEPPPSETVTGNDRSPLAIDAVGRRWFRRGVELERVQGGERKSVRLADTGLTGFDASPDARRVAIFFNRGGAAGTLLVVLDAITLEPIASFNPASQVRRVAWSASGGRLAVALDGGALVVDIDGGAIVARRCAGDFEARNSPPRDRGVLSAAVCE